MVDSTRVCELLVGLGDVEVLGVGDDAGEPLRVHIRRRAPRPGCAACGGALWSDGERAVELVDLPVFGPAARLVQQAAVALRGLRLRGGHRDRAGPADRARAREAHDACAALGDAPVRPWPAPQRHRRRVRLQLAPGQRVGAPLGLCAARGRHGPHQRCGRAGPRRAPDVATGPVCAKAWAAGLVDVGRGQLLDIVPGRAAQAPAAWLLARPRRWLARVRWAVLDLSGPGVHRVVACLK